MSPIPRDISPELVLVDPELAALARKHLPDPGWLGRRHLSSIDTDTVSTPSVPGAARENALGAHRGRGATLLLALGALSLAVNGFWLAQALGDGTSSSVRAAAVLTIRDVGSTGASSSAAAAAFPETSAVQAARTAPGATRSTGVAHGVGVVHTPSHGRATTTTVQARPDVAPARTQPLTRVSAHSVQSLKWKPVPEATYYDVVFWRSGKRVVDLWPTAPRVVAPTSPLDHGPGSRLSPGRYLWFVYPGFGAKPAQQYGALVESGVLVVQPEGGNEG